MGTVYMFFADGFEEMEAFTSVDLLKRVGIQVEMVSVTDDEIVRGAHGINVLCDKNIVNCDFADAALMMMPGGVGNANALAESKDVARALTAFAKAGKPIAAICAAPMVLGKLGIMKGKRATCYPGFEVHLEGAEYTGKLVEQDGNIITGKGPGAALPFALKLVEFLAGEEKLNKLKAEMCLE